MQVLKIAVKQSCLSSFGKLKIDLLIICTYINATNKLQSLSTL